MKVFTFDPKNHSTEYAERGYTHAKKGLTPEFLSEALAQTERLMNEAGGDLKEWAFKGKKQQFLFEFDGKTRWQEDVLAPVAAVAGVSLEGMMLCERHIKAYDDTAPENPPPHKDRVASEITVGLPLKVPSGSHIILFPDHLRDVNAYGSTALYRSALDEEQLPENLLKDVEPVRLDVQPGDVVLFKGNSMYHERVKPANTVLLYLKFNSWRLDPIGEDLRTPAMRQRSLELVAKSNDEALLGLRVEVSPRLDRISRHYTRLFWKEVIQAYVWGEKEFVVSEDELRMIRAVEGAMAVTELMTRMGVDSSRYTDLLPPLRRLVRLQALELLD